MRKNRINNIIAQKAERLEELQARSNNALDVVTSTINGLEAINEEIVDTITEIQDMKNLLDNTENGLTETMTRNSRIADRFKALIAD